MAPHALAPSIPRQLALQAGLGAAVGLVFAIVIYATDFNGIGSLMAGEPVATFIFFGGSAVLFAPLVVTTAIGLLVWDR
jgi:hypothetical protein